MGADGGKIRQCNLQTVAVDDLNRGGLIWTAQYPEISKIRRFKITTTGINRKANLKIFQLETNLKIYVFYIKADPKIQLFYN